ncbi:MAG: hypothetical protein G8237_04510 [Magnetococcales bacterium]|nr:hypothetical protein [Magnetococcales bacterium]
MAGRSVGVTRHEVVLEAAVPVAVRLTLGDEVEVVVDLVTRTVIQHAGVALRPKKHVWLLEIADFLVRQYLLEEAEGRRLALSAGHAEVAFEPRPKPGMIWWG